MKKIDNKQLLESIDKLKEIILELDKDEKITTKRWRAKKGVYFYIDSDGMIKHTNDFYENEYIDNFRYQIGNYYKTEIEAAIAKEKMIIEQELKDLADELNDKNPIDWSNKSQYQYFLAYDYDDNNINIVIDVRHQKQCVIYCTDRKFLDIALKKIGKERLLKLWK